MNKRLENQKTLNFSFTIILLLISFALAGKGYSQPIGVDGVIIDKNNQFGGITVQYNNNDNSQYIEYFDLDKARVKSEKIFSEDYPILNGLKRLIKYYSFDKVIKEESIFTTAMTRETLIKRSIVHFDHVSGKVSKKEEFFTRNYMGHSMIFYSKGKKSKIEWYYPNNPTGIAKSIVELDNFGKEKTIISYFTQKTVDRSGYYKSIRHRGYTSGKYYRNLKEIRFYSDDFSLKHKGLFRSVATYNYSNPSQVKKIIHYFDRNGLLIYPDI